MLKMTTRYDAGAVLQRQRRFRPQSRSPLVTYRPQALLMREATNRCTALIRCQLGSSEIFIAGVMPR